MPQALRSIVIVGDGIAAWLSAAMLVRSTARRVAIAVVGSRGGVDPIEVELTGSTLPSFGPVHAALGLNEIDLLRATAGTFKLGDEYRDWGATGEDYMHAFSDIGVRVDSLGFHQLLSRLRTAGEQPNIGDYSVAAVAARLGRFAHPSEDRRSPASTYSYAVHVDTQAYARFLRAYAEHLGVTAVNGRLARAQRRAADGYIESLVLEDGRSVPADLFVDCSGTPGDLISDTLGVGFESWAHWLPCDRALSILTGRRTAPPPVTTVTAHPAGCRLRIPVQPGDCNGLVYSAAHLTDEAAQAALRGSLEGAVVREARAFGFTQGRRRHYWSHNCVAIGTSAVTLEPTLAATLQLIHSGASRLLALIPHRSVEPTLADEYNRVMTLEYEATRDLQVLHYHATRRDDSSFWRDCRAMRVPGSLEYRIKMFRLRGHLAFQDEDPWQESDWTQVFLGQGVWPEHTDPLAETIDIAILKQKVERMRQVARQAAESLPGHAAYLARVLAGRPQPVSAAPARE